MNRGARVWLLLAVALVVVVVLVGGSGSTGPPYDPRSVAPDGARGVVETLERLGAQVDLDRAVPDPTATSALLLQDRLTAADNDALERWVRLGGVLVVADLSSALAAPSVGVTGSAAVENPQLGRDACSIAPLAEAERLAISGRLLDAAGRSSCFGDGNRAFIVAEELGQGTIVTIGSRDLFVNSELGRADAAVVAVSLLAPQGDGSRVSFIGPSIVEFGEEEITDLVPPRVWNAILQILAAFLLYALYRSRRLGGVVHEPVPVHIEGSELVLKAGLLSERAKDPSSAAAVLRGDVNQRVRRALSVPDTEDDAALASRISAQTGLDLEVVQSALFRRVGSDADLVMVTRQLSTIDLLLFTDEQPGPAAVVAGASTEGNSHD